MSYILDLYKYCGKIYIRVTICCVYTSIYIKINTNIPTRWKNTCKYTSIYSFCVFFFFFCKTYINKVNICSLRGIPIVLFLVIYIYTYLTSRYYMLTNIDNRKIPEVCASGFHANFDKTNVFFFYNYFLMANYCNLVFLLKILKQINPFIFKRKYLFNFFNFSQTNNYVCFQVKRAQQIDLP